MFPLCSSLQTKLLAHRAATTATLSPRTLCLAAGARAPGRKGDAVFEVTGAAGGRGDGEGKGGGGGEGGHKGPFVPRLKFEFLSDIAAQEEVLETQICTPT